MDFDPMTGNLWESDNGPECNDEINVIRAGTNYGWGASATCATPPPAPANTNQDGPAPVLPVSWFDVPVAPTGLAFCSACGLGAGTRGTLVVGEYNDRALLDVTLDATRTAVVSRAVLYAHTAGIRSVETGPGGSIYFSDRSGIYRLTR
jgi:glucose/arabinose dehydrogenase